MALKPNLQQRFGLGTQSNTCYSTVTILNMPTLVAVYVKWCLRCVCLIVCITLGPKADISHSKQNRYGWRWRTLLTVWQLMAYNICSWGLLDQTLSHEEHLSKTAAKLKCRNNLILKLATHRGLLMPKHITHRPSLCVTQSLNIVVQLGWDPVTRQST